MNSDASIHAVVVPLGPNAGEPLDDAHQPMNTTESSPYARTVNPRLPPELLANIFLITVVDAFSHVSVHNPAAVSTFPRRLEHDDRIAISRVCRHWRTVALNTPAIWGYLSTQDTPSVMLDRFIARSGQAPLHVLYTLELEPLGVFTPQLHRIKHLSLALRGEQVTSAIEWEAPLLEVLVVTLFKSPSQVRAISPQHRMRVLAPSLRRLELHKVPFHWADCGAYPLLTSLVLEQSQDRPKSVGTVAEMIATLRRMRALEELALTYAVPPPSSQATSAQSPVRLPRLKQLHVADTNASCAALLGRIEFPANTPLSISLGDEGGGFEDVLSLAVGHLYRPGSLPIKSLMIRQAHVLHIEASPPPEMVPTREGRSLEWLLPSDVLLTVDIDWAPLQHDGYAARASFSALLPRLADIEDLVLSAWTSSALLRHFIDVMRMHRAYAIPLPGLRELTVYLLGSRNDHAWLGELSAWLSERSTHGVPLAKLRIHHSELNEAELEPLYELVPGLDIEWRRQIGEWQAVSAESRRGRTPIGGEGAM